MGMGAPFRFRQFTVRQEGAAMKVGTDGILIGAWAPLPEAAGPGPGASCTCLDVGSGNGLLALMLAQRASSARITAIEKDAGACRLSRENFEASPWRGRLKAVHSDFRDFAATTNQRFDAIVSNPPFFREDTKSGSAGRALARQQDALPFDALLEGADLLLDPEGFFSLILPWREASGFVDRAAAYNMFPIKITSVQSRPGRPALRGLLAFGRKKVHTERASLLIAAENGGYTPAFRNLTGTFYLDI